MKLKRPTHKTIKINKRDFKLKTGLKKLNYVSLLKRFTFKYGSTKKYTEQTLRLYDLIVLTCSEKMAGFKILNT
jgi:hypothetical protein